jgi:two-component system sensor histidine kinase KdpD
MARGMLRIYLGAAPGVGKTYAMLNEGCRRMGRGTDVVVGFVEPHGRPNTAAQVRDLEVVPRRSLDYKGKSFEEMDVDAVLERKPKVALVDELAHTNVPGSRNAKRWQDIEELLGAGIDVISTVNIQHLESLNDVVEAITGISQRETVPDSWVRGADQIEIVDMTPEALRRRMAHGNVYPADQVDTALANYFRPGNLAALRELALLWVADRVEEGLKDYRERHGIASPWETRERVVVGLTGAPGADTLIRRASRIAQRTKAELMGVYVRADEAVYSSREQLGKDQALLAELGGVYREVVGDDIAKTLVEVARSENATQVVLGATRRSRWTEFLRGSVVNMVLREAGGSLDVHVISTVTEEVARSTPRLSRFRLAPVSRRRILAAFFIAAVGLPVLTVVLTTLRGDVGFSSDVLYYLLAVVAVATVGGIWPALAAAVAAFILLDWYFAPPIHTFTIADSRDVSNLISFIVVAVVVSGLVELVTRRSLETRRARLEAEALASMSASLLREGTPLPELVSSFCAAFLLEGLALLHRVNGSWQPEVSAGANPPATPEEASLLVSLGEDVSLAVRSERLSAEDQRVIGAFAGQLAAARERERLRLAAAAASERMKANELRVALLAAVGHDLRTPLASIKAAATSLRSEGAVWEPESEKTLLETIESEVDRLDALVADLLDMSRLQTGAYSIVVEQVPLDEVVASATQGVERRGCSLEFDVSGELPKVLGDRALLERAIANIIDNALRYSPPEESVRIEAGQVGPRVDLRVVDRGPGISLEDRERVLRPFQDLGAEAGVRVGLGLPVAREFIEAMGAELFIEDTPGGGTTIVVSLPSARSETSA